MKASEQDRADVVLRRQQWQQAIAWGLATGRFVFIDESSAKTNMIRLYGWAFGGERLIDAVPHGHWCTTTMIAAVGLGGAKAHLFLKAR